MAVSSQVQQLFPTTQTNSNQYDPALMGTLTDIINSARTQANTPYQAYPGQRYAQQTPEELQANQAVRDNFLSTQPMYQQSQGLINQGTGQLNNLTQNMGQWNPQQASQYMNPYISNVVQAQTNNMLNNANIERNRIRANAAQSGAFGGGRQFVAEQQMGDDLNRRLDDSTSNLLMQGYNTAFDQFNKDRQFGLEGVKQYGAQGDLLSGLAGARNNAFYTDVNNLNTVGQGNRDIAQANLDYDFSNFQNQRDYGKNQLSWISGLLNGTNLNQFQTGSTQTNRTQLPASKNSFTSDLMTGLGYAANLANTDIGKSIGSWISGLFANGGYVQKYDATPERRYAKGGEVKGYAQGGETRGGRLKRRASDYLEAIGNTDFGQVFYDSPFGYITNPLQKTTEGLYSYLNQPVGQTPNFNPMLNVPAGDTGAGLAGPPVMTPPVARGTSTNPSSISDMLNLELETANQPPSVGELMPQQQQAAMEPNPMDYFTYNGGPLDALMQPNPLLMQGLYGKLNTNDLGEMWAAANQIDALNNYEELRGNRMQQDTSRGSAIGELQERRANRAQDAALEQRKLDIAEKTASVSDPLEQAQIMKIMAEINAMGQTKPATAKEILDQLGKVYEATADSGDPLIEQKRKVILGQIMDRLGVSTLPPNAKRTYQAEQE